MIYINRQQGCKLRLQMPLTAQGSIDIQKMMAHHGLSSQQKLQIGGDIDTKGNRKQGLQPRGSQYVQCSRGEESMVGECLQFWGPYVTVQPVIDCTQHFIQVIKNLSENQWPLPVLLLQQQHTLLILFSLSVVGSFLLPFIDHLLCASLS